MHPICRQTKRANRHLLNASTLFAVFRCISHLCPALDAPSAALALVTVATFDANLVADVQLSLLKSGTAAAATATAQCAGGYQWVSAASLAAYAAHPNAAPASVAVGGGAPYAVSVGGNGGVCAPCAAGFYSGIDCVIGRKSRR